MADNDSMNKLETIYERIWLTHRGDLFVKLDESLKPRSPDMLFEVVEQLGLAPGSTALDVGCGRGIHVLDLSERFDFRVTGIDPMESNLEIARRALAEVRSDAAVTFMKGNIESIPCDDETVDLVWSRDMLLHVADLRRGIGECARVLKRGGRMIVFTTFATDLLEPKEATDLFEALGMVAWNLSQANVEQAFEAAGLERLSSESIGGELMEYYEEREQRCTKELMRLARMIRQRERLIAEMGRENYLVAAAVYRWIIYHLLGKLSSNIYSLRKA